MMDKKSASFAVIVLSVIAAMAAVGTAIYFATKFLCKRRQPYCDYLEYDDFDDDSFCDDDPCECDDDSAPEEQTQGEEQPAE